MVHPFRLSRADLRAARGKIVADPLAPDSPASLSGINPNLYTAAIGPFRVPGDRSWRAPNAGGFTLRLFSSSDERQVAALELRITDVVACANDSPVELTAMESPT
jgi:hypothetical protein